MTLVRTLLHLLLSLALVAGGVVPDLAQAMEQHHAATVSVAAGQGTPPCHETAADPIPPDPAAGCCDGGGCTCDCLHHAPVAMVAGLRLLALPADPMTPPLSGPPSPNPAPRPSLRPPIA